MSEITLYIGRKRARFCDRYGRFVVDLGKLRRVIAFKNTYEAKRYINEHATKLIDAWCFAGDPHKMSSINLYLDSKVGRSE